MPAAAAAAETDVVGKKALCLHLGWARPTLDNRLKKDPLFPVRTVGNQTGGWEFSKREVDAYLRPALAPTPAAETAPNVQLFAGDEGEAPPLPRALTPGRAQHEGERTARQLKDQADAEWVLDKLRRSRGELVQAADMRDVLATVLVKLRSELTSLPDALAKEYGLDERKAYALKVRIEAMMRAAVTDLRARLGVEAPEREALEREAADA